MISAKLVWKIECKNCNKEISFSYETDWFSGWQCGKLSEEDVSGDNAIESAREQGWKFERLTYEELAPICPDCKNKN